MAKVVPNLWPGTIPIDFSKAHPLFFYFLASLWMKFIAGDSVILMRLFPLLISLVALYVFHRLAKRHTNLLLANVAVVLLSVQTMFLAQASLVLPEILLFTLFILSFDRFKKSTVLPFPIISDYIQSLVGPFTVFSKEAKKLIIAHNLPKKR